MGINRRGFMATLLGAPLAFASSAHGRSIVLGFAQVGAESEWRLANSRSIKEATARAGIKLLFDEAEQKQEKQIRAIRSFIDQRVDVIAFSPVVENGWGDVLREAKRANIPVVLTDRNIDVADRSLFATMLGSDFEAEGRKAGRWLIQHAASLDQKILNVVELQGSRGAAPTIDRKIGFDKTALSHPRFRLLHSEYADFSRVKGREVMKQALSRHGKNIHVLYAHNDDMALGAIEAIEEAGIAPGKEIIVISVDAVRSAFDAMRAGKLNVTVECNPLIGPQLVEIVKQLVAKKPVPKRIITVEGIFPMEVAERMYATREY